MELLIAHSPESTPLVSLAYLSKNDASAKLEGCSSNLNLLIGKWEVSDTKHANERTFTFILSHFVEVILTVQPTDASLAQGTLNKVHYIRVKIRMKIYYLILWNYNQTNRWPYTMFNWTNNKHDKICMSRIHSCHFCTVNMKMLQLAS